MNGCNNCKFQPRKHDNYVCQKGHPSASDFPPCRDFVTAIKAEEIGEAIRDFVKETMEKAPNLQKLQTVEFVYIGLLRQGELGLAELPNANNYRRIEMGRYDWMKDGTTMLNVTEIEYPQAAKAWGMITHFGLFDSLKGGQLIIAGPIERPKMIEEGQVVRFESQRMSITLDEVNPDLNQF